MVEMSQVLMERKADYSQVGSEGLIVVFSPNWLKTRNNLCGAT